jgi:pyrroloquinoline-quinone synthase
VRRALAANLYEEQTGGISQAAPHPELFLRMMEGCGFSRAQFENVSLPPAAAAYRAFLDRSAWDAPWVRGAAVLTLFVEGSVHERQALLTQAEHRPKTEAEIEEAVARHPLVRFLGVSPSAMELVRVHQRVEGGHREDAWAGVLGHIRPEQEPKVLGTMREGLKLWQAYRDEVAAACGLSR